MVIVLRLSMHGHLLEIVGINHYVTPVIHM